jgi:DNA-directed RNA polymerase specialized sigma24 family protein
VDFDSVFEELYPSLFRYLHRLTGDGDVAEDIAQEAFVRLLKAGAAGARSPAVAVHGGDEPGP